MNHALIHAAVWEVIERMADDVGSKDKLARKSGVTRNLLLPSYRVKTREGPIFPKVQKLLALCDGAGWTLERFGREFDQLMRAGEVPERPVHPWARRKQLPSNAGDAK